MNWLNMTAICLSCTAAIAYGQSFCPSVLDATKQPISAARGVGPTPGSQKAGHSAGFPVRLSAMVKPFLTSAGTAPVEFEITNVGRETIRLPVALDGNEHDPYVLTLYLSVPGGQFPVDHFTSAELYAESHNLPTFCRLAPGKTLRVHASTRFRPAEGYHAFTAHAEFIEVIGGTPRSLGFADSKIIHAVFQVLLPKFKFCCLVLLPDGSGTLSRQPADH